MDLSGPVSGDASAPPPDIEKLAAEPAFARDYAIERMIGHGAFGVVLSAVQRATRRRVAIKVLTALSSPEAEERFLREGRMLARLRHRHIVQVYDVGVAAGMPYMALQLIEGGTIEDRLGGARTPAEALAVMVPVAAALGQCHAQGIVHRDLKPANILIDGEGQVLVADFGLARSNLDARRLTAAGTVMGTPRYLAPESVVGDDSGPPADVYAAGLVLYELLAGRGPYDATSPQDLLMAHAYVEPHPLLTQAPAVPPALAKLVDRCLSKDPKQRPENGVELAGALAAIERQINPVAMSGKIGAGIAVARRTDDLVTGLSSATQRFAIGLRPPRRSPWIFITLTVLTVAGLIALGVLRTQPPGPPPSAPPMSWPRSAAPVLHATRALLGPTARSTVTALAFTPDGKLLAGGTDGQVRVYTIDRPELGPRLIDAGGAVRALSVSGGGRWLAVLTRNHDVGLFDLSRSDEAYVRPVAGAASALAFHRSAATVERLALITPARRAQLVEMIAGGVETLPDGAVPPHDVADAVSAGALGCVFALSVPGPGRESDGPELWRYDVTTGGARRAAAWPDGVLPCALVGGDRAVPRMAMTRATTGVLGRRWVVETYELRSQLRLVRSLEPPVRPCAVLPSIDPAYLAVGGPGGELAIAALDAGARGSLADWRSVLAHRARITALAAGTGGRLATAAADGSVSLWTIAPAPR